MDAVTPKETRFLPALANAIADWFPQLEGRSLAVSEVEITKENLPTLPLAMVAFIKGEGAPPSRSRNEMFDLTDTFVVEFWMKPEKYQRADGSETPFWTYYPYDSIRDTLLKNLSLWEGPGGERVAYRGLGIDAEPFAVTLTFTFIATFRWCANNRDTGEKFEISYRLCTPKACMPEPTCLPELDECDPCK